MTYRLLLVGWLCSVAIAQPLVPARVSSVTDGDTVKLIILPDGTNVNALQVRNGQAWVFRRYCKDEKYWIPLEREAQAHHLGLWAQPGAVAPWEYRHPKRTP